VRRERTRLTVAGRTDAGVHARGQVASHDGEPARAESLNAVLPPDIRVLASERAADGFDARRDAVSRTYRYRVLRRAVASPFERAYAFHVPRPVDPAVLDACAASIVGTHDFTAFTPTETDHVRFERDILRAEWVWEDHPATTDAQPRTRPAIACFWIEADAFMRNMVRVLVGTMLEAASGQRQVEDFLSLLGGAPRERAGETAPAHGLYLASVRY
jgi:tRNA pseudouridine38-40 synthase